MTRTLTKSDLINISKDRDISQNEILILLSHVLNVSYSKLFFEKEFVLYDDQLNLFNSYIERRSKHEPIAKIVESKEFYGIKFKTNKHTLDPRPETELLIDTAKDFLTNTVENFKILDLCCGTGCIGLTLLSIYANATCDFVDISHEALDVAIYNAHAMNLDNSSSFIESDLFDKVDSKYDLIVSNPPYVSRSFELDLETSYDPELALFADNDGIAFYEIILNKADKYLNHKGYLILEIGFDQLDRIKNIKTNLKFVGVFKDLQGINRVCVFQNF